MAEIEEQAGVLALVAATASGWHRTATLIEGARSALKIVRGEFSGLDSSDIVLAKDLHAKLDKTKIETFSQELAGLSSRGINLITVLDDEYPTNLREVYNRPPFLFVRGRLLRSDDRAVAVVGTRDASHAGIQAAKTLSSELARAGVTVLSGLAKGIDTSAHVSALESGRTVAIMGTGINRVYPPENADLAERIVSAGGALVSQFWPDSPPIKSNFPLRNVVTSGMGIGTVVIEASSTSGAKMQARLALEHGKRLFLIESLVMQQEWARKYATRPGVTVVRSVQEILDVLIAVSTPVDHLQPG